MLCASSTSRGRGYGLWINHVDIAAGTSVGAGPLRRLQYRTLLSQLLSDQPDLCRAIAQSPNGRLLPESMGLAARLDISRRAWPPQILEPGTIPSPHTPLPLLLHVVCLRIGSVSSLLALIRKRACSFLVARLLFPWGGPCSLQLYPVAAVCHPSHY